MRKFLPIVPIIGLSSCGFIPTTETISDYAGEPQLLTEECSNDVPQSEEWGSGWTLFRGGEIEDAQMTFAKASSEHKNSSSFLMALGTTIHFQGNLDVAIKHYEDSLALNSDNVCSKNNLGIALVQNGQLAEGLEKLDEAFVQDSRSVTVLRNYILAKAQKDGWESISELMLNVAGNAIQTLATRKSKIRWYAKPSEGSVGFATKTSASESRPPISQNHQISLLEKKQGVSRSDSGSVEFNYDPQRLKASVELDIFQDPGFAPQLRFESKVLGAEEDKSWIEATLEFLGAFIGIHADGSSQRLNIAGGVDFSGSGSSDQIQDDQGKSVELPSKSVFMVKVKFGDGSEEIGTTWILTRDSNSTLLVTCAHVIRNSRHLEAALIEVISPRQNSNLPNKVYKAEVENISDDALIDLAVLRVHDLPSQVQALFLSREPFPSNEELAIMGHSEPESSQKRGKIFGLDENTFRIMMKLSPGDSGSPIVDDRDGTRVIGMVFDRQGSGGGRAYSSHLIRSQLYRWGY